MLTWGSSVGCLCSIITSDDLQTWPVRGCCPKIGAVKICVHTSIRRKTKKGERGYVCFTVGYETRKISILYDTWPWKKANRKRGGFEEENGDGQLSIAANATISTADDSVSVLIRHVTTRWRSGM